MIGVLGFWGFGDWQYGLITGALLWTLGGTAFLIGLGWILRLVGVEYDLQKKEAAYRKILVVAEDDGNIRPKTINELFDDVRSIHFLSYTRYLYFNIGRMAYLQANVLSAYVFLAPAIVAGVAADQGGCAGDPRVRGHVAPSALLIPADASLLRPEARRRAHGCCPHPQLTLDPCR